MLIETHERGVAFRNFRADFVIEGEINVRQRQAEKEAFDKPIPVSFVSAREGLQAS